MMAGGARNWLAGALVGAVVTLAVALVWITPPALLRNPVTVALLAALGAALGAVVVAIAAEYIRGVRERR